MFLRVFGIFMVISLLFLVTLDWDELVRAGWPFRVLLAKLPIAGAVSLLAAGVMLIFQRRPDDDDE